MERLITDSLRCTVSVDSNPLASPTVKICSSDAPPAMLRAEAPTNVFVCSYLFKPGTARYLDTILHTTTHGVCVALERTTGKPAAKWLQPWVDCGRAMCLLEAESLVFRQFDTHSSGKEIWHQQSGLWELYFIKPLNPLDLSQCISLSSLTIGLQNITQSIRKRGHCAQCFLPTPADMHPANSDDPAHWQAVQKFWHRWDELAAEREALLKDRKIDWAKMAELYTASNLLLSNCPDRRLQRLARLSTLPLDHPLTVADTLVYVLYGPICPYVGQCGRDKPRALILRMSEHEARAAAVRRAYLGNRVTRHKMFLRFRRPPSVSRAMAQLTPGKMSILPVQQTSRAKLNGLEHKWDCLMYPTLNAVAPRKDASSIFWEGVFTQKAFPTRCSDTARYVNDILQSKGLKHSMDELFHCLSTCRAFVHDKLYQRLFRVVSKRFHDTSLARLPRRITNLCAPPQQGNPAQDQNVSQGQNYAEQCAGTTETMVHHSH